MANRISRRNRRNEQFGYDWVNTEFPFTSVGKAVPMFLAGKRAAQALKQDGQFSSDFNRLTEGLAVAFERLTAASEA